MRHEFLGDSYDAVKRLWCQLLGSWATVYAHPQFIPLNLQTAYTHLTKIAMLPDKPRGAFSILNDPDTGIKTKAQPSSRVTHVSIELIVCQCRSSGARCVITFDQSFKRSKTEGDNRAQRQVKLRALTEHDIPCFYYASHATFLFAFASDNYMSEAMSLLVSGGIPQRRIEQVK
jgi:hypothetical protein